MNSFCGCVYFIVPLLPMASAITSSSSACERTVLVVSFDMKLRTERPDRVDQGQGSGDGVAAGGRFVEAVAEEEHPIRLDEGHGGVIRAVSADVPTSTRTPPSSKPRPRETRCRRARSLPCAARELRLDVLGVLRGGFAGGDAALERLVAPVHFGELLEVARR